MRLKDDDEATLGPRRGSGSQRGCDLGRMMPVVVDEEHLTGIGFDSVEHL